MIWSIKAFSIDRKYKFKILHRYGKNTIIINFESYKDILWKEKVWRYTVSLVKHVSFEGRRIETGKFKILKISPPESLKKCKSIIDFIYKKKIEHQRWIREVTIFFRKNVSKKYCLNDGRDFVQNLNVSSSQIVLFCFQLSIESWFILPSIVFWYSWEII